MRLTRATGAASAISRSAMMVGASLAAVSVVWLGPLNSLVLDAVSFAISAALLWAGVPARIVASAVSAPSEPTATGFWREFVDGARYLAAEPLIRNLVLMIVITNCFDAAGMLVLKPVYARTVTPDGSLFGVMVACFAFGALAGAGVFGWLGHRLPRRATLVVCFILAGPPPYIAMALDLPVPALLSVFILAGLSAGSINPLLDSVLYEKIPRGMRARVLGALTTGVTAGMPLGSLLGGIAVEQAGLLPTARHRRRSIRRGDSRAAGRALLERVGRASASIHAVGLGVWPVASTSHRSKAIPANPPSHSASWMRSVTGSAASGCSAPSPGPSRSATTFWTCSWPPAPGSWATTTASASPTTTCTRIRRPRSRASSNATTPSSGPCDAVVIVGSDYTDVASPTELSFNARIAANLGAPVLLVLTGRDVEKAGGRSADQLRQIAEITLPELAAAHAGVLAVVVNRADPDAPRRHHAARSRPPTVPASRCGRFPRTGCWWRPRWAPSWPRATGD